jgi:hypothetical protein
MKTRLHKLLLGALVLTACQTLPAAEKEGKAEDFLRIRRDDAGAPLAMETSITSYAPADGSQGLTVDLVGAVHIADKAYFDKLNAAFASYDAVLYELVAPHGATPNPGERSTNAVSFLQTTMKSVLALQFQLDCVDYKKANFVHADMTPEEFASSMKDRGESFAQMFLRMFGQSLAMQSRDPGRSGDAQLLAALFASPEERSLRLKRIMADQFQDMEAATSVLDGPDGSTILTERNKAALRVLKREMATGKKRIAIFYGAAHLPDMEERLIDEFHLKRTQTKWLTAWDLTGGPGEEPPPE